MSGEGPSRVTRRTSTAAFCAEEKYRLMKTLGLGAFSKVKLAVHVPTGQKVAIKIMSRHKMKDMEDKVKRELKVMKLVVHPHIVRLYEVFETPTDICMVMEYVESGDLFDYIVLNGRLGEDESRHFFQQILAGVEYCHLNRVVHRDLKPENLLLDGGRSVLKIADFGLSNIMHDGQFLKTSCGSPNYAAPEVIQRRWYAGPEVDVWSCGVILYAMLCGVLPFDDENISSLYRKIIDCMYTLPSHLSVEARDLITCTLKADPLQRITIAEIRRHAFFQTHLPRYIAVPPNESAQQAKRIDDDIVLRVARMGYDPITLMESLLRNQQTKMYLPNSKHLKRYNNYVRSFVSLPVDHEATQLGWQQGTVAYYLLLDSQRKQDPNDYLESEFDDLEIDGRSEDAPASNSEHGGAQNFNIPTQSDGHSVPTSPMLPFEFSPVLGSMQMGSMERKQGPLVAREGNWAVGLQSQAHPSEIMMEVLKALQELDIVWKTIGAYYVKCRWVPPIPKLSKSCFSSAVNSLCESPMTLGSLPSEIGLHDNMGDIGGLQNPLKFEVQLYKTREGKYLLDLQRVEGPCYLFLDLCASFLAEVGAV